MISLFLFTTIPFVHAVAETPITLYSGFITKIRCEGKVIVSAVGEENLVAREVLPQSLGCGVLLKPLAKTGRTNLILETSTGSINSILEIAPPPKHFDRLHLELKVKASE